MLQETVKQLHSYIDRLNAKSVAIAYSGGGDSTALLHMLASHPSVTHAFIIDHNLRAESAAEVSKAAKNAQSLGYDIQTERWVHDGVSGGIQAKAREFRYGAMGEMCRRVGVEHLLTAHTADDQAETLLMRKARLSGWRGLAGMAQASYAPLWPALADITLHRPLLDVSRQALRDYNREHDLSWIEDPSNENHDFSRIKARSELGVKAELTTKLLDMQTRNRQRLTDEAKLLGVWLSRHATLHPHGHVTTQDLPPAELLQHILRAVSGTGGPIEADKLQSLSEQMAEISFKAATLAGAWVLKTKDGFLFARDVSAVKGRTDQANTNLSIELPIDCPVIWDGRFIIRAKQNGLSVKPAYGHLESLGKSAATREIMDLPKQVRPTLPVFYKSGEAIGFGALEAAEVTVKNCVSERLSRRFAV